MQQQIEYKPYSQFKPTLIMRTSLDPLALAQLVVQIDDREGLDPARPLVAVSTPGPDGKFRLLSGNRRWLASMLWFDILSKRTHPDTVAVSISEAAAWIGAWLYELDADWLTLYQRLQELYAKYLAPVVFHNGDPTDYILATISHNFGLNTPDPLGVAHAIQEAEARGNSPPQIASAFGKSELWLKSRTALLFLSDPMAEAIATDRFPLGLAQVLTNIEPPARIALEQFLLAYDFDEDHHFDRFTLDRVRKAAEFLALVPPKQELIYDTPQAYNRARLLIALWGQADTPFQKAAEAAWKAPSDRYFLDLLAKLLAPEQYQSLDPYNNIELDESALVRDFLPDISCDDCQLAQLPDQILRDDLNRSCRKGNGLPGACAFAPGVASAPWVVRVPWSWAETSSIKDDIATSFKDLLAAWEHQQQKEEEAGIELVPEDGILAGANSPIKKQRAMIRHFIEHHGELASTHVLATPCPRCEWHLDASPTKNPDVPPCEWARRTRSVEFFVRAPQQIGPAIPVCRQFKPALGDRTNVDYFADLIPEHPLELPPTFTDILRHQIRHLVLDARGHICGRYGTKSGVRLILECFTGRPLKKSDDYSQWITSWLNEILPHLTFHQVPTLWHLIRAEWECARMGHWGREYHLLVGDILVPYKDEAWIWFWTYHGETTDEKAYKR